ncbi:ornithine cyclodeaminase family protein [Caulobacter segnis]|uniref:ornithine cyclodeaminase family protein n=1 Tax=Caulobacter segnis TaxID=88688 RepID=UPI00240FB642|nr:ornithine cyclodeaminase family protein [Caulobacter segnis]MDG2523036.1 ornithine cyclodeaminase family protein [Caulobacter segnis]
MDATIAGLRVLDVAAVRSALTYEAAMPLVREAMIALSTGRVRQELRSFIGLGPGRTFAIMPAAFESPGAFGAKLVSVFNDGRGRKAHEGLVVLFDGADGAPVCLADAGEVTAIRTAAASAVATDALARPDARRLAVLGMGRQAETHIQAIALVRDLESVVVWGREAGRTTEFAARMTRLTGVACMAVCDARRAVEGADIICTVTAAAEPILLGGWVSPGAHVNLVGSSGPAQAETDGALVARSRYVVDHREHVLVHGGEFLRAKAAGLVGDDHIAAEIGQILSGEIPGRTGDEQVTVYKSLGHAVQDIACVAWLNGRAA